jgi:RNA-directed DNA polymerase
MARIGGFPAREQIRQWLKAGVVDRGRFAPTEEGTPQGGVISPLLLNMALQGLEEAAGVEYDYRGIVKAGCPTVVTYADDFVVMCHSREQAQAVQAKVDAWLVERGLTLNQEKTTIRHVDDGFDFLSLTIRRYHPKGRGTKVLTRPSKEALARIRRGNADTLRSLRGTNAAHVIRTMNPRIRGQANYFRSGASKEAYQSLDEHLWRLIYKWTRHSHPGKPWKWIANRYYYALAGPAPAGGDDRKGSFVYARVLIYPFRSHRRPRDERHRLRRPRQRRADRQVHRHPRRAVGRRTTDVPRDRQVPRTASTTTSGGKRNPR